MLIDNVLSREVTVINGLADSGVADPAVSERGRTDGERFERVLVVEDNDEIRFMMSLVLEERCIVDAVATYDEALEQVDKDGYHVIFIDIDLGETRTGLDLARKLRRDGYARTTSLVACTAYAMPGDREHFLREGFDYYIGKPFTEKDLLNALDQASPTG